MKTFQEIPPLEDISVIAEFREVLINLIDRLPHILFGLIVLILVFPVAHWAQRLIENLSRSKRISKQAAIAFGRIARYAVIAFGILLVLTIIVPSVNVATLIGSLGLTGVIIGFAFRDILQNFFAGLILLIQEPFSLEDQIVVGSYEGTVKQIDLRSTKIHTYDGRDVIIPNADLFTDSVLVNTAHPQRRSQYDVGIGYGDDIDTASDLIFDAMKSIEGVLAQPAPDVRVWDLGDSAVVLRARWWTNSQRREVVAVHDRVLRAIATKLTEHGIDMPYPTQVLLFHDQTEETDGNRAEQREGWPSNGNNPKPLRIAGVLRRSAEN